MGKDSELKKRLIEAVDLALGGDWEAAHLIAQEHEDQELANLIHAVAHRMEGDLGNAVYWYRRVGRTLRNEVSIEDELREIRRALLG